MHGDNTKLKLAAQERGEMHYMGPPCKKGHIGKRYASTGCCVACLTHKSFKPLNEGQTLEGMHRYRCYPLLVPKQATPALLAELDNYMTLCAWDWLTKRGVNVSWLRGAYDQAVASDRHVGDFLP